ncbi:metallophosphoesterase MPPED2-like isoform X2 [Saccostrea echinata]|nr:metallophosphoesterase MPPED2-like isoform X2 [Saccostrea echinata]XP_061188154.1 metallophosphoesterase MPPED2-like isoform X2 [Saccostrea echinata]
MFSRTLQMLGLKHKTNMDPLSLEQKRKVKIKPDPETHNPTKKWDKLKVKQKWERVTPIDPTSVPLSEDTVRFVCISDTHAKLWKMKDQIPTGDVLLHAGDFTNVGWPAEVKELNDILGQLPHKHKIVIAGNHDLTFDDEMIQNQPEAVEKFGLGLEKVKTYLISQGVSSVKELLTNCLYLEDACVELYGIKIYGSPWQPEFFNWGFNLPRGQPCLSKWDLIPCDTDILITHGPPLGHGDKCYDGLRAGCLELLNTVQKRIQPKYHVFGHIHEAYGCSTDGITTYINASSCTLQYKPVHPPIVFDFPLPPGHTKDEVIGRVQSFSQKTPECDTVHERDGHSDSDVEFKED